LEETVQLDASDGTTWFGLEPLNWTRPWKTLAKYPSTVKNPYCGSRESNAPASESSVSRLEFFGLSVIVEVATDVEDDVTGVVTVVVAMEVAVVVAVVAVVWVTVVVPFEDDS